MAKIQIISQTPIDLGTLKKTLEQIKQRDGELSLRSQKTYDYLNMLPISIERIDEIVKKVEALNIPRLKSDHIIKITNIMPSSLEELKFVLQGYGLTVSNDNLDKIFAALTGKNEQ